MTDLNGAVDSAQPRVDAAGETQAEVKQPTQSVEAEKVRSDEVWQDMLKDRAKAKEKAAQARREAADLRAKLDEIEKSKAQEQGKYKELFEKRDTQYKELYNSWLKDKVQFSVSNALNKAGCVDSELALAAGKADLLEFDESTGQVDGVDAWLQDLKERKPVLFQPTKTPTINPTTPGGGAKLTAGLGAKDYSKLSAAEIKEQLKLVQEKLRKG